MGRAYSEDLRSRIVTAVEAGATRTAAAAQFAVSVSCAIKLVQRFRQTGSVAPAPRGKKPFALAEHEAPVRELVAARLDMTLPHKRHDDAERAGFRGQSGAVSLRGDHR
jgi:transposase